MQNADNYLGAMAEKLKTGEVIICDTCGFTYNQVKKPDGEIIESECPRCLIRSENQDIKKRAANDRKQRDIWKYNRFSVSPATLTDVTTENYHPENQSQQTALEAVKLFTSGDLYDRTLFFQGDTGVGKSHLAYAAHKDFLNNMQRSIYIDSPSLMDMIKQTYGGGNFTQEDIMEAITDADLFILDDIGAEYVKPDPNGYESWAAGILYQIANNRLGKQNIYTTNFSSGMLNRKYGTMSRRILSRMMDSAKILKIDGRDRRLDNLD